jgi:hypothetical protein
VPNCLAEFYAHPILRLHHTKGGGWIARIVFCQKIKQKTKIAANTLCIGENFCEVCREYSIFIDFKKKMLYHSV